MDKVNSLSNCSSRDMDSGDILVSSVRTGMKREFAAMMKAQSEMGGLLAGRRVTRSQGIGSPSKSYSASQINKKIKRSDCKKDGEEKIGGKDAGKLEVIDVAEGDKGVERDVVESVESQSEMGGLPAGLRRVTRSQGVCSTSKGYVVSESEISKKIRMSGCEKDNEEKLRGDDIGKLEVIDVLEGVKGAHGDAVELVSDVGEGQSEKGGLSAGQRRVTRSQVVGSSRKGYVLSDSEINKKMKGSGCEKDEEENLGSESWDDVWKLEVIDVFEGNKRAQRDVVEVASNVGDCARSLEADLAVKVNEAERVKTDCLEGAFQSLFTDSPVPQVGGCDRVSIQEDDRMLRACNLGCESTGDGTSLLSEKPHKRFTRSALKLQDGEMELESRAGVVETSTTSPSKLEMKMSKKIGLKRIPTKLKDLLETGLLEGLHVRYIHGSKGRKQPESELKGVIQGTGILCLCNECQGRKVITPNQFELHADSGNKRPPEYIYLENGKSLRDVLNACKADLSGSLEAVIQNTIGRTNYTAAFCVNCRGLIPEAGAGRAMLLCDSCFLPREPGPSCTEISDAVHRAPSMNQPAVVSSSCQPDVQEQAHISSTFQPQMKRKGKLTRKDLRMHKSVLAEDLLPDGAFLTYVIHEEIKNSGIKKDGAILCFHCNELVSPSQFEAHAGFASRRKPYMSIYTSNGVSLHQLSLELSKCRKLSTEENDDLCSICEDGGDLLCCENCPRAFHTECVGLPSIPQGIWYCKYCQNMFEKEKFAERNANAIVAGRVPGIDPLEEITQRCIRIMVAVEKDRMGGCAICSRHNFSNSGFNNDTVLICDQCEKEYHVGCLKEQNIDDLEALPETEWFCSRQCSTIHLALQKLISDGEQKLPEAVLNILEKKSDGGSHQNPELDTRWRLLRGSKASEDTRMWLSGAVTIFHDRFDPIAAAGPGRLDLIPAMVYGRKLRDQDFCGMYCAILMVGSVVVSAAILRVFGEDVAELPLVATRTDCQGKGYFQSLFILIENLLASLNVKDLVLPAADEAESLWKNRFGFEKIGQEQLDMYKKRYQMMLFEGTSILHKLIMK